MQSENNGQYQGSLPYIFISCSGQDSEEAAEIITHLQQLNCRMWYNDGKYRSEEISSRVSKCSCFVAFMSDNYIASARCRDELNIAHDNSKSRLLIYLHEVNLPNSIQESLDHIQNIHKYTFNREIDFYQTLVNTEVISRCRSNDYEASNHALKAQDLTVIASPSVKADKIVTTASVVTDSAKNEKLKSFWQRILSDPQGKKLSIVALICSIVAMLTLNIPFLALILSIAACAMSSAAKHKGNHSFARGFAKILSILFIILSFVGILINMAFGLIIQNGNAAINSWGGTATGWINYFFELIVNWIKDGFGII